MNKIYSVTIEVECGKCHKISKENIDNEGNDVITCECGNEIRIVYELEAY